VKRRTIIAFVCAIALWNCRRETPAPQPPTPKSAQQTTTDATAPPRDLGVQAVELAIPLMAKTARCAPSEKTTFAPNEQIPLTLELIESPSDLQVSARITDAKGKTVAESVAPGEGKKSVTLAIKERVKPGKYKLAGYWGGNVVCEREIAVE
jgi:hypothetical protein